MTRMQFATVGAIATLSVAAAGGYGPALGQHAGSSVQAKPAAAAAPGGGVPELLARYGDWAAYVGQTAKTRVCYALSQPKDRQPATLKRDPGFFFISHRPGEGVRNEISAMMGFPLKDSSDATLQVGNLSFTMTTKADNAWVKNPAEEPRLVEAMRKGRDLSIRGTSRRGNASTDVYSLSGLSQALDRIEQECK